VEKWGEMEKELGEESHLIDLSLHLVVTFVVVEE
jgi:hypothetical protein